MVCRHADSVLLGAVRRPQVGYPARPRPAAERALLGIRKEMGLYANIRPARLLPELRSACPLRESAAKQGFDMVIVRESTGGIYFGDRGRREGAMGPEPTIPSATARRKWSA